MKQPANVLLCLLLVATATSGGCSRHSRLADRIARTDRVLVLRRAGPHRAVSMSLEGKEVNAIVTAAASAAERAQQGDAAPAFDDNIKIAFLIGSNVLAVIVSNEGRFSTDGKEYMDETGTLSALRNTPAETWRPFAYDQYERLR
jgi:hypothetical protein